MKERLTGAIILVALIVLLVPELLTGPIRSTPRPQRAGTAAEESALRSYTINLGDDARGGSAVRPPAPAQVAPAAPGADSGSAQPATAAQQPAPTPASSAAAAPPTLAASADGAGWVVQLGSFANRANAERLAQQLRARGFQVGVSRGSTGRRLYRVRAGPARDRAAALQLQAKLRAAGHGGAIVPQ